MFHRYQQNSLVNERIKFKLYPCFSKILSSSLNFKADKFNLYSMAILNITYLQKTNCFGLYKKKIGNITAAITKSEKRKTKH